jgi:Gram-negative bacterial TonB protein C-terminal
MRSSLIGTPALILACVLSLAGADKPKTIGEAITQGADKISLTTDGVPPFHLKVKISEPGQADSDYVGTVDLLWAAPGKWRRTVESPDFSQTAIMNGDSYEEANKGEYYPLWLRNLALASTDPLTALAPLRQALATLPFEGRTGPNCGRVQSRVGIAPTQNNVFTVICFTGDGLLESVTSPGFSTSFKNYKSFAGKHVARQVSEYLEPGVTVVAEVLELEPASNMEESSFAVSKPIPAAERLVGLRIDEATIRQLAKSAPDIVWPSVRGGKTNGALSIYVAADRDGHVRETYPLNSDNPLLNDTVRGQVAKWEFKRATSNGVPVQIETILTFGFGTTIENPPAIFTDAEARKQAVEAPEPVFPAGLAPSGTQFTIRVSVDEQGRVAGTESPKGVSFALGMAANAALEKWRFKPFLRNGKPDIFKADLVFRVP